jgi:hypothetical protein
MTPTELLEKVKLRFNPLILTDEEQLQEYVRTALTTYQDRAGLLVKIRIQKESGLTIAAPDDYLELVGVTDQRGMMLYCDEYDGNIEIEGELGMRWPLTMTYLKNLRDLDLDSDSLPAQAIGVLLDYLEVLIAIPNTELLRTISIAGKLDVSNLSDENTLYERKKTLEQEISARRAIIPGAVIMGGGY